MNPNALFPSFSVHCDEFCEIALLLKKILMFSPIFFVVKTIKKELGFYLVLLLTIFSFFFYFHHHVFVKNIL